MSLISPNLKDLEELTLNAKQIQDNVLEEILKLNANTEYLGRFLHGSSDKELFKKNVPVVTYEDLKSYIDRVANGESSNLISGKPITRFVISSGTSGGRAKIFPINDDYFENLTLCNTLISLLKSKHVAGVNEGKTLRFRFSRPQSTTPCGLPVAPSTTYMLTSTSYKNRPLKLDTTPDEVLLCTDSKQTMYCHWLCGLLQRDEIVIVGAPFISGIVRAIKFLENYWKELCSNIRSGYISEWITDIGCRNSVSLILEGPNPVLADLIEKECSLGSWEGIITRLWPKIKLIDAITTGQMTQYIPILEFYSNKLPLVSSIYVSSETIFGINMNPLSKPQDVSYTFLPNIAYFEFLSVDEDNNGEILDLVNVKLGCYYEPLVTNYCGLHRCKIGDILQVTGFYNDAPGFRFVRRKNVVLSIDLETTTEEDLLKGLSQAKCVLEESSCLMLTNFTSCVDISTVPGHYVLYWELEDKTVKDNNVKLAENVMMECCCVVEESFDAVYKKIRKVGIVGALEIRVVQNGAFDHLMDYFISRGSSIAQYKTPICINSPEPLAVLENRVIARFFSDKSPSC